MNTFHNVTLQNEMAISRPHCSRRTRTDWPPTRARMNRPTAPDATHSPRNVHTGISARVIFIIGQLNPQPRVSSARRTHIDRGSVCEAMNLPWRPLPKVGNRDLPRLRKGRLIPSFGHVPFAVELRNCMSLIQLCCATSAKLQEISKAMASHQRRG